MNHVNEWLPTIFILVGLILLALVWFRLQGQVSIVCQEHRILAATAAEAVRERKENSERYLPKANIPGLTHKELVENTEHQFAREKRTAEKLENVARHTC